MEGGGGASVGGGVGDLRKETLHAQVRAGRLIGFASREYDAGHRCDHVQRFLHSTAPYMVDYEFGCEPYTVLPRSMAHEYEERFVGYGKDRVSWNYELAAKGARFWVSAESFLVHYETFDADETRDKRKSKYGHFPTDWMLGESCWPDFRERVEAQYNYSLYTCHQTVIDGLHRGRTERCAAERERLCVKPYCTPRQSVLRAPLTLGGAPRVVSYPEAHLRAYVRAGGGAMHVGAGAAAAMHANQGPRLVMLGCEGCGVPELWRTLVAARPPQQVRLQVAHTSPTDPAWRDRQVSSPRHELHAHPRRRWCVGCCL